MTDEFLNRADYDFRNIVPNITSDDCMAARIPYPYLDNLHVFNICHIDQDTQFIDYVNFDLLLFQSMFTSVKAGEEGEAVPNYGFDEDENPSCTFKSTDYLECPIMNADILCHHNIM